MVESGGDFSALQGEMKKSYVCLFIALWLAVVGTGSATTYYVSVGGGSPSFFPDFVQIHQGDTVQWDWQDPSRV